MAKPASGTALDTGHALYSGMEAIYAFLEGTGTTSEDSKGSNDLTLSSSGLWSTDGDGPLIVTTSNSVNKPAELATRIDFDGTTSFSIAFRAKQTTGNDNGMLMGNPDGTGNYIWLRDSNYWRVLAGGANAVNFTSLQTFTTMADYVLTYEFILGVSNLARLYKDGTITAEGAVSVALDFQLESIGNGFDTGTASLGFVGSLAYVYVWRGRVLDATEAASLSANPYGIFTGGGGGGLSIPVAMAQYRQRWA